jgi:N-acetylglutamate synthase-like GNAT family acetyltransferase
MSRFLNTPYPILIFFSMTTSPIHIRPATENDQARIVEMIREAQLYPLGLKWQRFLVAEADGAVVGIVQLKTHQDGAQELGSLAVVPERQKEGIGGKLIRALLAKTAGAVYLDCHISREKFYEHFGFRRAYWRELPLAFKFIRLFLLAVAPFANLATKGKFQVLIMKREPVPVAKERPQIVL